MLLHQISQTSGRKLHYNFLLRFLHQISVMLLHQISQTFGRNLHYNFLLTHLHQISVMLLHQSSRARVVLRASSDLTSISVNSQVCGHLPWPHTSLSRPDIIVIVYWALNISDLSLTHLSFARPELTVMVDRALNINYLSLTNTNLFSFCCNRHGRLWVKIQWPLSLLHICQQS